MPGQDGSATLKGHLFSPSTLSGLALSGSFQTQVVSEGLGGYGGPGFLFLGPKASRYPLHTELHHLSYSGTEGIQGSLLAKAAAQHRIALMSSKRNLQAKNQGKDTWGRRLLRGHGQGRREGGL